jgi:uncharacterized protein (DUF1778 family)
LRRQVQAGLDSGNAERLVPEAKVLVGSTVSSLTLSKAAFEAFAATCEKPPQPTAALRKLMSTPQGA